MKKKCMGNEFILVELRNKKWIGCPSTSLSRFGP
jgi:hypothetical protein